MNRFWQFAVGAVLSVMVLLAVPGSAGAADNSGCYVGCSPPVVSGSLVAPVTAAPTVANPNEAGSSSLPFTGADVVELSAVGIGAVLAGGMLARRRRVSARSQR